MTKRLPKHLRLAADAAIGERLSAHASALNYLSPENFPGYPIRVLLSRSAKLYREPAAHPNTHQLVRATELAWELHPVGPVDFLMMRQMKAGQYSADYLEKAFFPVVIKEQKRWQYIVVRDARFPPVYYKAMPFRLASLGDIIYLTETDVWHERTSGRYYFRREGLYLLDQPPPAVPHMKVRITSAHHLQMHLEDQDFPVAIATYTEDFDFSKCINAPSKFPTYQAAVELIIQV